MEADNRIPAVVAEAVMASMNAAANQDAETPRVVIDSLQQEERALIVPFEASYSAIFGGVGARGSARMLADYELDRLIAEDIDDG